MLTQSFLLLLPAATNNCWYSKQTSSGAEQIRGVEEHKPAIWRQQPNVAYKFCRNSTKMPKTAGRPYWEPPKSASVHRRIFISKNDSCPQPQSLSGDSSSIQIISRASTGNASFTAASITRRELPQRQHPPSRKEDCSSSSVVRSVESIYDSRGLYKAAVADRPEALAEEAPDANSQQHKGLVRNLSQRLKNQVQGTLSEPFAAHPTVEKLNGTASAGKQRHNKERQPNSSSSSVKQRSATPAAEETMMKRSSSVRRCVSAISHRLHLKNLSIEETANNGEGGELPEPQALAPSTSDESIDDDPEVMELQEREQIVEKYEKGPDQKDIDPWENPDFELYKMTDRYGFVHKDSELTKDQIAQKKIQKELERESKWLQMLAEWKQRHPAKLPERIWKGVPDKLRLEIWRHLLRADDYKLNAKENLYQELLMRARLISKDIKQIDLDINRTYRDHVDFRKRYDFKQQSLFNVLTAYAMLNTEVGYCQGMSQIAAIFLMYMDEENAFWCMHSLLVSRKFTMHGFFVPGFPKLHRFQNHYDKVLLKYLPRVKKHLDSTGIPPIYLTKWWFGCFLDRVPFSLALRLWDVFLYYGDCILIAMALNIMKMHKKTILKLNMEDFMEFIQTSLSHNFGFPDDKVMDSLHECLMKLQNDRMALPPPPNPRDPAEVPTKPLGPILTRSMLDIRSDIAEVYSRCSRANSLAGRSPAVHKRHYQNQMIAAATSRAMNNSNNNNNGRIQSSDVTTAASSPSERTGSVKDPSSRGEIVSPPVEPFLRRVGSTKDRKQKPPPVPDEDGFVRMSPRQRRAQQQPQNDQPPSVVDQQAGLAMHKRQFSQYDNVVVGAATPSPLQQSSNSNTTTTTTSKSSTTNYSQPRPSSLKNTHQRAPILPSVFTEHRREVSTESQRHQVHRTANNVTYVTLEMEEENATEVEEPPSPPAANPKPVVVPSYAAVDRVPSMVPYCPPPDYPGAPPPAASTGRKSMIPRQSSYQQQQAAEFNSGSSGKYQLSNGGMKPQRPKWAAEMAATATTSATERQHQNQHHQQIGSAANAAIGRQPQHQQGGSPMARPLYSRDETTVIRRF